ncbi:uncharacterized protein [Primulina eburnea]|uniref:uncharacterized protein n=1 Tax=Primulina eburnea TaxID=1245227 RepID=UPI003C6C991E
MDTRLEMSTAYHPQTDGQTERKIQTLEDLLRAVVMDFKDGWQEALPLLEFSYNNSFQVTIGVLFVWYENKFVTSFFGPYEIFEGIGTCAYRLDLPQSFFGIQNIFHVSMLHKYDLDPSHVIQPDEVELDLFLSYTEYPVCILDRKDKFLLNKLIPLARVQWSRHGVEESTWEREDESILSMSI